MGGTTIKKSVDENATEKSNQVRTKKIVANINEIQTKRAALGDIENRGLLRFVQNSKDTVQKDLNDKKLQNALRNAKASVDTYWKKLPLGGGNVGNNVEAGNKISTSAATTIHNADGQRRMLLLSNSVRLGSTSSTTSTVIGQQRQSSTNVLPSAKPTTANVKVAENKLATVAIEKLKSKTTTEGKTDQLLVEGCALHRQDSQLSRISLTKFRAVLSRDASSKATAAAKSDSTAVSAPATKKEAPKPEPVGKPTEVIKLPVSHSYRRRLEGVEDIDADDKTNLVFVSEFVNDIYDYLYTVEEKLYVKKDHLDGQVEVDSKMRAILMDWINEVHMQFLLAPETFHMAVAIIDLYLQNVKNTKRLHLQLVGVTALFIATKYEKLFPPAIRHFVYITDYAYTTKQIRIMEVQILKALDFNLSRPLPIHFLRRYSKAAEAEDAHHAMSKYFLELAAIEYELASYKPSEIAAASLFLTLHLLNGNAKASSGFNNTHWTKTLEFYSRYSADDLRPIAKKIAVIARNAPYDELKAVYSKYQSTKFLKTATRPELYGALIDSIINSK